jgi:hypothetical protein
VLRKAVRQAQKARSCREASADLAELLQVNISPSHLGKLAARIGLEWAAARDKDVQDFKGRRDTAQYAEAPQAASVMVDGGTLQTRQGGQPRGAHEPSWREFKVACCQTLASTASAQDPQPLPPAKFLDPPRVARLAAEVKARRGRARGRCAKKEAKAKGRKKRKARGKKKGPAKLVRTVLASMANSEEFGWQVAAEAQRRGLDRACRKAYVCDGQKYNWTIFLMHFVALGFVGILDFVHLLSHLYAAAQASAGKGAAEAWQLYERWLRLAWAGQVTELIGELKGASERLGAPPQGCPEEDARKVVAEALGYVRNNRERMDYPRYRRLGLPICSAPVEGTVKQLNARLKGTEKFWLEGGAEALLLLRAAHLSEDGTAQRYWDKPRPYQRAVGAKRLRPAA